MWLLYQVLLAVLTVLSGPFLLVRRGRHYLTSVAARLGGVPVSELPTLWVHAVSVGEVNVAASLVAALPGDSELLVTTVTPSGQETARGRFPRALVTYLPFELGFAVRRFFERLKPRALILCEGDLWPLVLREASRRKIPVIVVNGRVSERSFRRMYRLRALLGPLFSPVSDFAVQTEDDAQRLRKLGVSEDKITVTGNLKFEVAAAPELPQLESAIRELADRRPVLVAGSTMRGEEEQVLRAFEEIGCGERALLILAPRHPERWTAVAARIEKLGLRTVLRSDVGKAGGTGGVPPDVLLLDSLGELASVYRLATAAFVGGTLVATGGHNPLEAAHHGTPIVVGPSMHNFKEIADRFDRERAWERVDNARELAAVWNQWLEDPERASAVGARGAVVVAGNRGALAKTEAVLAPLFDTEADW